jgi:2-hydroxy-3-keto-5-methylthiopentenyl-1-phosphate phosphatase
VLNTTMKKPPNPLRRSATETIDVTDVFCDFDGTITQVDATDAVLEAFALPAWKEWEQRWINGEITSQECLARQVELIQADRDTLAAFAADLPIDEGILELNQLCKERGASLTIVSDGMDLIVEAVLRRHGLLHLSVFSNHICWDQDGRPLLKFPFAEKECESGAGTCKCSVTLSADLRSSRSVYIGDGRSDQCVSGKMQTVFAKGTLLDWCEQTGISCIPFETLAEVADRLFVKEARIA